jgi:hypothetical protein
VTPYDELTAWFRGDGAGQMGRSALDEARRHGVHLLVAHRAGAAGSERIDGYAELARELRTSAVLEAARAHELQRVIETLADSGVCTLVFKGAALAYSVYPEPYLRPSSDFDILIRAGDCEHAFEVLRESGYEPEARITSDLIMPQRCMTRRAGRITHTLDVHWKLVNPVLYSDRLTFDGLWSNAVAVPRLSGHARMPALADHLLISCLHRIAHHQNANHLIWLYDIHLLASCLDPLQYTSVIARARAAKLERVCHVGLVMADAIFGVEPWLVSAFAAAAASDSIAGAFLSPQAAQVSLLKEDWRALDGVRPRLRLLREHLFPPVAYIRSIYPRIPAPLIPLAYLLRVLRGAPKWFSPAA